MSGQRVHEHPLSIPLVMPSDLYCAGCVEKLRCAVATLEGVESVDVDRRTATLTVSHDVSVLSEDAIEGEVRRLGFAVTSGIAHTAWRVTGLD